MCTNCARRGHPCSYAPYPKRRGPGKAPKGQRKSNNPKSTGPSSGYGSATSNEQDIRRQTSAELGSSGSIPMYYGHPPVSSAFPSTTIDDLHRIQRPPANEGRPGVFSPHLQYPMPAAHPASAPPPDPRMRDVWRSTSQASLTTNVSPRDDGSNDEDSPTELYDFMRHEHTDRRPPPFPRPRPHQRPPPGRRDLYR